MVMSRGRRDVCQVDGCSLDLDGGGRSYYKRHGVCVSHPNLPVIYVNNDQKRFWPQYSK